MRPEDVPGELRFAAIWSNPPIRVGKAALHDMLLSWLPRWEAGGTAYLVVQKNLGSDSLQRWLAQSLPADAFTVSRYASDKGFRVSGGHTSVVTPSATSTAGPASSTS